MGKSNKKEKVDEVVVVDEVTVDEVVEVVDEVEVDEVVEVVEKVDARSSVDILTLNHRTVVYTIDNGKPKTKSIQRAEHKAIAAGDYSSLK